jgi:hypothetical protein
MKIMVMMEGSYEGFIVPIKQPLEGAYQDTYVEIEHLSVEPTVTHIVQKEIEHAGETYYHNTRMEETHPKVAAWFDIGYDHDFYEEQGSYPYIALWLRMSRKVVKTGWFIDLATLEDLAALLVEDKIQSNVYVGHDFQLEDETMLIVVAS